jgi:hypothetical protein
VGSNLVSNILYENGVITMPGLIYVTSSGSFKNTNLGSQMEKAKKIFKKYFKN